MYYVFMDNLVITWYILLVIIVQTMVIFFDNHFNINIFFSSIQSKKIASAYTKRSIYLYFTRSIFFIIPPLLGFGLSILSEIHFLYCFFSAISITFLVTLFQFLHFVNKKLGFDFVLKKSSYKFIYEWKFYIGVIAFSVYLISPFILNYLALFYQNSALWIVQLNPLVSSVATTYIVFVLDPKISVIVDEGADLREIIYESILIRILGRSLILFIFIFIFFVK